MNGNKKINNLKKVIVLISISILIVAVILIMSIYNNKFGKVGDDGVRGGKKTASTQTSEVLFDSDDEISHAFIDTINELKYINDHYD